MFIISHHTNISIHRPPSTRVAPAVDLAAAAYARHCAALPFF